MNREKRLTKKERRQAIAPRATPQAAADGGGHIHCIACGRHLHATEFADAPPTATQLRCQHGKQFPSCVACAAQSKLLIADHDRTNQNVRSAAAWH